MAKNIRKTKTHNAKQAKKLELKTKKQFSGDLSAVDKRKAKTAKGRRILKKREPQVNEAAKNAMILKGNRSTEDVTQLLKDFFDMRKPLGVSFVQRKHDEHPFEDAANMLRMCNKEDCGLFCLGSSAKKRPFRLIFGRLFNSEMLDMMEFGVSDFIGTNAAQYKKHARPVLGAKPMLVFQGDGFASNPKLMNARSLLMDFFRGPKVEQVSLKNLETVLVFTATAGKTEETAQIVVRHYKVTQAKSGTNVPEVAPMKEIGPRFTLTMDREQVADPNALKQSLKKPKEEKAKKTKNISTTELGRKVGRLHLGKQDFTQIYTPHGKRSQAQGRKEEKTVKKKKTKNL